MNRRDFLKITGWATALSIPGIALGIEYIDETQDIRQDWERAQEYESPESFLNENEGWLKNISLGTSFSPWHLQYIYRQNSAEQLVPNMNEAISLACEFGTGNAIRIPIYMDQAMNENCTEVTLENYRALFTALKERNIPIWLNFGIKTFRWPETHLTNNQLNTVYNGAIPRNGHKIGLNDPLAQKALWFQREILSMVKELGLNIAGLQPENEPFFEFGERRWTLKEDYLVACIRQANEIMPEAPIMINTGLGTMAWFDTLCLIQALNKMGIINAPTSLAINCYGVTNEGNTDSFAAQGLYPFAGKVEDLIAKMKEKGIPLWFSEMQMEPWYGLENPNALLPGNSWRHLVYMLLRMKRYYDFDEKTLVMPWGIEELMYHTLRNQTPEHQKIIQVLQGINQMGNTQ